jgi:hypothetical protein
MDFIRQYPRIALVHLRAGAHSARRLYHGRGQVRFLLVAALLLAPAVSQAELGINVYGLSYHFERGRARELGVDNEVNPGLGLRYQRPWRERLDLFADAGAYRDSGRNTAVVAGAGGLWKATERLRLGGALAVFDSDTYNRGRTAVAPIALAAWEFGPATLNVTFFPKISEINEVSTLGFWLTLWPARW